MKTSFGIRSWVKNRLTRPNKDALFIFGLQKSGTSAIAGLLAELTDKSVTIDTKYLWGNYASQIILGNLKVENHVKKYSYPFSKKIIKEPGATFFIHQLNEYFNLEKYVFIVRNPYDNIRSILNRLDLPGNLDDINLEEVPKNWKYLFEKTNGKDYISTLAYRWKEANNQIDIIESKSCILIRYEDFLEDKEVFIKNIACNVGFKNRNDIKHILNKQFQPGGEKILDFNTFYGEKNSNKIQSICSALIKKFNY